MNLKKSEEIKFDKKIVMNYLISILIMGLNHSPSIRDYFSEDKILSNEFLKNLMKSERRFFNIHRKIHFDLDFLIEKLNINFKKFYLPTETFVIDETMILFKGKTSIRQYVPLEPNNTGLKFYCLCDSNKYLFDFFYIKVRIWKNLMI